MAMLLCAVAMVVEGRAGAPGSRGITSIVRCDTSGEPIRNANVTAAVASRCSPPSVLTNAEGAFTMACANPSATVAVWARQYHSVSAVTVSPGSPINLSPRAIPNFPAAGWQFEGWPIEAQTGDVPGTPISFLAHPSAYRTPSGRIFLISTANSRAGPGWTQGYWQQVNSTVATAAPGPLIDRSHPVVTGIPFTARFVKADGRLLMLIGMAKGGAPASILENRNLADPSNPAEWVAAEGDGHVVVNFTGAPTGVHEDYRLHVFDDDLAFECNGVPRKYWLFVIPDDVPGVTGRACGRMGFAAPALTGPYTFCNWVVDPAEGSGPGGSPTSDCASWPGDVIRGPDSLYFVAGWGNLYRLPLPATRLQFTRLAGDGVISTPAPQGAFDDFKQIEFTFLPPPTPDGRWRLYHASYSNENGNPNATRADYGYKQAVGMYTFDWGRA
mmetsp:Transcript_10346/g.26500  ORF Transcript_10346/g.26500 Transcript_10346/m.26500 type:complete len:442 (-) Transcript_10346:724-2049(-)